MRSTRNLPNTVQDGTVWKYSDVNVRHDDVVEVAFLLVGEEQVRHPHSVRFSQSQVLDFTCEQIQHITVSVNKTVLGTLPLTEFLWSQRFFGYTSILQRVSITNRSRQMTHCRHSLFPHNLFSVIIKWIRY